MLRPLILLTLLCCSSIFFAQTPITAVSTSTSTAAASYSYTIGANTYNWGLSSNNIVMSMNSFTAGGLSYSYATTLAGSVKLRRVDNPIITGIYTLLWAEYTLNGSTFNMFPAFENNMEPFFNTRVYNKGSDNFFQNNSAAANSNNIERLDWLLSAGYSTPFPSGVGFAIFERGADNLHDPFCIAAITSLDESGNPASYGNIVRVATADYGNIGPDVTYRILKNPYPQNLADAGTNTQSRGGVFISYQNLGIAANQTIYGYSLFANDLPLAATPANLIDYTNSTFFPTNTGGSSGGIDLAAVTGIFIENSILPVRFIDFSAVSNNDQVSLKWIVSNETNVNRYIVERSTDGVHFTAIKEIAFLQTNNPTSTYQTADIITGNTAARFYYRIRQVDNDGHFQYSKIIAIQAVSSSEEFSLYPNPVAADMYVTIKSSAEKKIELSIYNNVGESFFQQVLTLHTGFNSFNIEGIQKLPHGVYFAVLTDDEGQKKVKKFMRK